MSSVVCIENKNYFLQNPLHGVNDGTHNKEGTCTTVAMQMLMGYHNYYSDRRLIPEVSGNTRFLHQDYGDFYYDPIKYNGEYYGFYGCPQIGTEHAFYERLLQYTQISSDLNNQTIPAVANAANSFVNDYSPQIKSNVSISSFVLFNSSDGVAEIDAGRPILLGYNPIASDATNFHAVVAFGYARYNDELGFLIHSGWYEGALFYWVPSRWIGFQIRMSVNHTHTYERTEIYYGAYSEFVCSECGSKKYDIYYTTDSTGQILTGVKYPLTETITIPSKINGIYITEIGPGAFANKEMTTVEFENNSKITKIGSTAFENCKNLSAVYLADSVISIDSCAFIRSPKVSIFFKNPSLERIGYAAFYETSYPMRQIPASVKEIGAAAFSKCVFNSDFSIAPNSQLIKLNLSAFGDTALKSFLLPKTIIKITKGITKSPSLTFYTDNESTPSDWINGWNNNRPVVWNCTLSDDYSYVVSFTKSATNPSNSDATNGISNPIRFGYTFDGWYTTADFKGKKYNNIKTAPNGVLFAKWKEGACVSEGSLITLADGTQKAVEDLTGSEQLLVWNLFTGTFDTAPILFIDHDPVREYEVISLMFSDGTTVKVISEHGFWDFDLNEYVFLRSDAAKYIGHWFNKQTTDENGNFTYTRVQLTNVIVQNGFTSAWSPVTYGHLCYYVNGMLSMPGATTGLINIFNVDTDTMKIDETKFNEDIAEYGLFTYEEFAAIIPVPEVVFEAFGGKYFKVAIGKGILSWDMINALVVRYSEFFEEM